MRGEGARPAVSAEAAVRPGAVARLRVEAERDERRAAAEAAVEAIEQPPDEAGFGIPDPHLVDATARASISTIAMVATLACAHPFMSLAEREALARHAVLPPEPPRLNRDGYYEATLEELNEALMKGSALRWVGAPVQTTGLVRKIVNVDEAETRGITQGEALVFLTQKGAAPGGVELVCQIAPPVHLKEGDLSLVRGQIIAYYKPAQIVLQCESAERR